MSAPHFSATDVKQAKAILVEAKADPHSLDKVDFLSLVHDFTVVNVSRYGGKPIEADVEVIAIGTDPAWVDLPGEIFVELRKVVKNDSVFRTTIINEQTNDAPNYIPNRKAFEEGACEVKTARCTAGCGETLAVAAIDLLAEAYRGDPGTTGRLLYEQWSYSLARINREG